MATKTKLDYSQGQQELRGKASKCPYCGSDNLDYQGPDVEGESAFYDVTCCNCDAQYKEWYKMIFDGNWGYPKMKKKGKK